MVSQLVMIIDDDKNDRFFFKTSLAEIDPSIECIEARNCLVALAILHHADSYPDFIFLDSHMPGISGAECLQQLKQDAKLLHIPIIMFSGALTQQQIDHHVELGAAYSLVKSDDFMEWPEAIKKVMEVIKVEAVYKIIS